MRNGFAERSGPLVKCSMFLVYFCKLRPGQHSATCCTLSKDLICFNIPQLICTSIHGMSLSDMVAGQFMVFTLEKRSILMIKILQIPLQYRVITTLFSVIETK